jgi:CBS domain-containing protein
MPRDMHVREVMTTDVLTFRPEDRVEDAYREMTGRGVDGGPVVDEDGAVVGMLTTDDLLVQETKLHFPTVISLLAGGIELPSSKRRFEEELRKAVGSNVADVMTDKVHACAPDDTLERAATVMHDRDVSRLPVTEGGKLVGIIARGDILRAVMGPA